MMVSTLLSWFGGAGKQGGRRKQRKTHARRAAPRPSLELLEARMVPTVTAVPVSFATTPNTPTALEVQVPNSVAANEPVSLAAVGAVSPGGPTLTRNADGSLTFSSAGAGKYTFNYTVTGAQQEVTAFDGSAGDDFGVSVAISGDTAVVGDEQGQAAHVFMLSGSTWSLQQELYPNDAAPGDEFGASVAIDGDTVVVGAYGRQVNSTHFGAVYVFTRTGVTWTQQQEITAAGPTDSFGTSVAISGGTSGS